MHPLFRAFPAALLLCAFAPSAFAQYSIDKIVFHNAAPYTDAELLATSGLAPGQFLVHDSLATAAQHLLDTGLFSDASVSLSGQGKARTVLVDLKSIPLDKLLPASFENLVWFTPAELSSGIHARVPLYRGVASDSGTLPDAIQAALQQMLTSKGITATLSHTVLEPTTQHPVRVVDFKLEQPSVLLAHVTLTGLPDALKPDTAQALDKLRGTPYNEGLAGLTLEDATLAPAHNAGYIRAKLDQIQRSPTVTSNGISVDVTANLIPGDVYKLATVTLNPTPLYSASDFTRDTKLHTGDLANDSALQYTEAQITKVFLAQGYMDAYVLATPIIADTAHTVANTQHAVPGDPYHLHTVTATGLSPEAQKAFDADWQMKPGDPYSDLAVGIFLSKHVAQPLFRPYDAIFRAEADPQTHLVDLALTFTSNNSKAY